MESFHDRIVLDDLSSSLCLTFLVIAMTTCSRSRLLGLMIYDLKPLKVYCRYFPGDFIMACTCLAGLLPLSLLLLTASCGVWRSYQRGRLCSWPIVAFLALPRWSRDHLQWWLRSSTRQKYAAQRRSSSCAELRSGISMKWTGAGFGRWAGPATGARRSSSRASCIRRTRSGIATTAGRWGLSGSLEKAMLSSPFLLSYAS